MGYLKTLIIARGLPGSGKTALAEAIAPNNYAADNYGVYDGDGNYLIQKQAQSHKDCFADTELAMRQGAEIIAVHNTFVEQRFYIDYLILAAKWDYFVQVIDCEGGIYPDGSSSKNAHKVPQEFIENMASRWEPYEPLIPKDELDFQIQSHAERFEMFQYEFWQYVKLTAEGNSKDVPADFRKDTQFWRIVNSYRYWNEAGFHIAKRAILESYQFDIGIAEFAQLFDRFWYGNYEFYNYYKTPVKKIVESFLEFCRIRTSKFSFLNEVPKASP